MAAQTEDACDVEEWEDETVLLVELKGLPNGEEPITTCRDTCTLLGLDTLEPMLQLDQYVFKGSYEDIIGTAMIFEQSKGAKVNYLCKTNKKLAMTRVLLKQKKESREQIPRADQGSEQEVDIQTTPTQQEVETDSYKMDTNT